LTEVEASLTLPRSPFRMNHAGMDNTHPLYPHGENVWKQSLRRCALSAYRPRLLLKKDGDGDIVTNIGTPNHPDRLLPPPSVVMNTSTSVAVNYTIPTGAIASTPVSSAAADSHSMGTAVLSIAVGSVAAFIIVPALAVLAFLYIRRWRNRNGTVYGSLDDEQSGPGDYFSRGTHHYHDEIQLKDYENESKSSFEEVGTLTMPESAVHVFPIDGRSPHPDKKAQALGSGTIRSP
jgi:hypothetical protein